MQVSELNASSSLLDPLDILRFVYESGESTELTTAKRWEEKEKNAKDNVVSAVATTIPSSSSSSSAVQQEINSSSEKLMSTNVESENTPKSNKYTGLQKLLVAVVKSHTECKYKESTMSDNTSLNEQTVIENVTSSDDKQRKLKSMSNVNDDVNTEYGNHKSKLRNSTIADAHDSRLECARDNAASLTKISARLTRDSYETRVALSDVAQELACSAVQRALTHHSLPEERYHRSLWQLIKCSHEQTHLHRKLDTVTDLNDNYTSTKNDREEYHHVKTNKLNNTIDHLTEMWKSNISDMARCKSPFADITTMTSNEQMTVESKEIDKPLNKIDNNGNKEQIGECRSSDANTIVTDTINKVEKCHVSGENDQSHVITSNDSHDSDVNINNNSTNVISCDMTNNESNMHRQEEEKAETILPSITESITDNISELLVQRYLRCCEVLHTRPLQCVKHVLCKSEKTLAHSISSSESLQNRTSSSPFASINEVEPIKSENDNEQEVDVHIPSSSTAIMPIQAKLTCQSDMMSESRAAGAKAEIAAIAATTSATTVARPESENEKNDNAHIDQNNEENVKKEGDENSVVERNVSVTPNVQEKVTITLPSSTPLTIVPSSPSRSQDMVNMHKPTQSDTTASSTTSQQPSTVSLVQLISLNFDWCKNLSDAREFVAVLGVLEIIPQLYRLCFADTDLSSEQLCTLVLLCEAHLPLLHSLDVSGNMRLDDTAGLAILRLTALRPTLKSVYVDDTNISRAIAHQIHTAVKHNRRTHKQT